MSVRRLSWKRKINVLFLLVLSSCAPKPYYKDPLLPQSLPTSQSANPLITIYLVGDAGKATEASPVIKLLKSFLEKETSPQVFTLFLGDNLYPYGLPDPSAKNYAEAKSVLDAQIQAVKPFRGRAIFIPGNHDWALDKKEGWQAVQRQQAYVQTQLDTNSFLPRNGCPGPEVAFVNEQIALIVYDSQWWIHQKEKPDSTLCPYGTRRSFLEAMNQLIQSYQDKVVIIAAHHPFFSCSSHGGRFSLKEHLFPLRFLNANAYLPLPILGSFLILLRYLAHHPSDAWNPHYKSLKKALLPIMEAHPRLIYVSGHDHNLQYRKNKQVHHVISGSATKISEVGRSPKWEFTYSYYGLGALKVYENQSVSLEFWAIDKKTLSGKKVYQKTIIP